MTDCIRVLMVEDNDFDTRLLREMLQGFFSVTYEIDCASTLRAAFGRIEDREPDVILLDLGLPDSQGLETLLDMRKHSPALPIIVLTGYDDEERAIEALHLGAQDYLVKGEFKGAYLVRAMRYAIDRNQTEEKLRQTLRELEGRTEEMESFVYSVSHDLKEPLRTLEAFSQFLLEDYTAVLDETGQDYLNRISRASARLKDMIEELLVLSRLGRRPHELARVNANEVVEQIIASAGARLGETGGSIEVEGNLPDLRADQPRVEQIFGNLVNNGLKFNTSPAPKIRVSVLERDRAWVTFRIEDNGIGIPEEYHERIFGAFQRLHTREDYEGTGAGLAIVKRAAEAVDGRVWLESTPGEGSVFYVRLPLWEEAAKAA